MGHRPRGGGLDRERQRGLDAGRLGRDPPLRQRSGHLGVSLLVRLGHRDLPWRQRVQLRIEAQDLTSDELELLEAGLLEPNLPYEPRVVDQVATPQPPWVDAESIGPLQS